MSLEYAKKYGFISSIMMVILPIISILIMLPAYIQRFIYLLDGISTGNIPQTSGASNIVMAVGIIIITIAGLTAYILFLTTQYKLSKYYKEPAIFRNILYSIILAIIYTIIVIIGAVLLVMIAVIGTVSSTITNNFQIPMQNTTTAAPIAALIVGIIAFIIITIIVVIINGLFWKKSFDKLAEKSGIDTFKTAGLLFLIGSFIPLINYIAWILAAQAYKKLQPTTPQNNILTTLPDTNKIYCTQCGTENNTNHTYCKQCGTPLTTQTTQTNNNNTPTEQTTTTPQTTEFE